MKKNHQLFQRDPKTSHLVNDGQARIVDDVALRYELEHFVCEGQYASGFQRILDSFLSKSGSGTQSAAWVSGFYGSGKSHLLKMLAHLWVNTGFPDGATARALVPDLPDNVQAALVELDNAGKRGGGGVFSVWGSMPEGSAESARLTVLGFIFRACGLPAFYNQARFCLFLQDQGYLDRVKKTVEDAGKEFDRELNELYASPLIRKALMACDPGLGDESEVRKMLREQFPNVRDIDTSEFIRVAKEVLKVKGCGKMPLTAIILDEVQHYIGDDKDRSKHIAELTEALNKQMESSILLVAAGQNALSTDTPQFAWLRDRYTVRVELSDTDVETVTRKVLLKKKAEEVKALGKNLDDNAGEIERQLVKSKIGPNSKDRQLLVTDYPLLPTRRRFWEHSLRSVDPSGSSSLLRTQLRITHEALRQLADRDMGTVVGGDFMFFQQQAPLVQQGILSSEISNRILRLDDGTDAGKLKARVCGLVFLIRRLPREKGADAGVRATEEMLADLLVEDLARDGQTIRNDLPPLLEELKEDGVLIFDGEEYNLQTRESAEWDDLLRVQLAKIKQDTSSIHQERKKRIHAAVEASLRGIKLRQGASQTPREITIAFGPEAPDETGREVPVWIRDGWEVGQNEVIDAARAAGADSPTIFVFLQKNREDSFRDNTLRMKAAEAVIGLKGAPASREAEEARDAMAQRQRDAQSNVDAIIRDILSGARVFKGGGTELHALELIDKVQDGADDALVRLFPRFGDADHKAWEVVIRRARQGDDTPLEAVGWKGATADHPVCKEILAEVGSGKEGRHLRAHFEKPKFGWPRDAIDAALICLHSAGHLTAIDTRTNEPVPPKHLDQNRIPKTHFRCESVTLKATDRIALKGLFQAAGLTVRPEEDLQEKASEYLAALSRLAAAAGGSAPLPAAPETSTITRLRAFSGNQQLQEILAEKAVLQQQAGDWKQLAALAEKRLPGWSRIRELLAAGDGIASLEAVRSSVAAVEKDRLLLDGADHVAPLAKQAADALRVALTEARASYTAARQRELDRIEASPAWQKLPPEKRELLLSQSPLAPCDESAIATEEELLSALTRAPLASWRDRTDALASRAGAILAAAASLLEPKAKRVPLPSATLRNEAELQAWLEEVRETLSSALKEGPVIL